MGIGVCVELYQHLDHLSVQSYAQKERRESWESHAKLDTFVPAAAWLQGETWDLFWSDLSVSSMHGFCTDTWPVTHRKGHTLAT